MNEQIPNNPITLDTTETQALRNRVKAANQRNHELGKAFTSLGESLVCTLFWLIILYIMLMSPASPIAIILYAQLASALFASFQVFTFGLHSIERVCNVALVAMSDKS